MHPVPIDDLINRPKVLVDVFVKLIGDKFVLIAKAGALTPVDHLSKFRAKGLNYLYVRSDDFVNHFQHAITIAGMAVGSKALSNLSKLTVIEEAMGSVYREIDRIGIDEVVVSHAKLVTEAVLIVVAGNPALSQLVARFSSVGADPTKHAMLVSMVATLLGQGHEWIKPATLEKLALGGLLHDIGKTKLPPELVGKNFAMMTRDEKVIYKSHPEIGRQMLSGVKGIPDDVVLMVYEHHEQADGSGYPRGIKDFLTSPLARVISLANGFAETVMRDAEVLTEHSARKAFQEIEFQRPTHFNKDAMRVLKRLIEGGLPSSKKAG